MHIRRRSVMMMTKSRMMGIRRLHGRASFCQPRRLSPFCCCLRACGVSVQLECNLLSLRYNSLSSMVDCVYVAPVHGRELGRFCTETARTGGEISIDISLMLVHTCTSCYCKSVCIVLKCIFAASSHWVCFAFK